MAFFRSCIVIFFLLASNNCSQSLDIFAIRLLFNAEQKPEWVDTFDLYTITGYDEFLGYYCQFTTKTNSKVNLPENFIAHPARHSHILKNFYGSEKEKLVSQGWKDTDYISELNIYNYQSTITGGKSMGITLISYDKGKSFILRVITNCSTTSEFGISPLISEKNSKGSVDLRGQ